MSAKLKEIITALGDIFIPRVCPGCSNKLSYEQDIICSECLSDMKMLSENEITQEYNKKFVSDNVISGLSSIYYFEKHKKLQRMMHELKYQHRTDIGTFFGKYLGSLLKEIDYRLDVIIPIPLHKAKKAERGYNQAYYIAKGIGQFIQIGVSDSIIKRKIYTSTQTKLDFFQRKRNIKNAFVIDDNKLIADKNILLVDDVITTGATINECAKILIQNGANKVYAASIALAEK